MFMKQTGHKTNSVFSTKELNIAARLDNGVLETDAPHFRLYRSSNLNFITRSKKNMAMNNE